MLASSASSNCRCDCWGMVSSVRLGTSIHSKHGSVAPARKDQFMSRTFSTCLESQHSSCSPFSASASSTAEPSAPAAGIFFACVLIRLLALPAACQALIAMVARAPAAAGRCCQAAGTSLDGATSCDLEVQSLELLSSTSYKRVETLLSEGV